MATGAIASLYDFEYRGKLFPAVDSRMKFAFLTLTGPDRPIPEADFLFFAHQAADLRDDERHFTLSAADIALLNPNTRTCPIFRSGRDAELTKAIYRRVPILVKEGPPEENPWGISFMRMFDMANDSGLFRTQEQLEAEGWQLQSNRFVNLVRSSGFSHSAAEAATTNEEAVYLPLYEAKMIHHFDHRWATYEGFETRSITPEEKDDPTFSVLPRYLVSESNVNARLDSYHRWLLGFRDNTNITNERTAIFNVIPGLGAATSSPSYLTQQNLLRL